MPSMLDKLKARQDKLNAQIKTAKLSEQKRIDKTHAEKCRAIGFAILADSEANPAILANILPLLDKHTKKPKTRKMLGLEPLKKAEKKSPANAG